jgi:hypothetical protein
MADGTGLKQYRGKRGELRVVVGVTPSGRLVPLGCFVNTPWDDIEKVIRAKLRHIDKGQLSFIYDGEPSLDEFLADVANTQRCLWHGPRGLYHSLWQEGLGRAQSAPYMEEVKRIIGVELPHGSFELLRKEDKKAVRGSWTS